MSKSKLIHPKGEILHILAAAGVPAAALHEVGDSVALAYKEANETAEKSAEEKYEEILEILDSVEESDG